MSDLTGFRTYGGWRRPGRPGLGHLGFAPTIVVFVGLVATVAAVAFSARLAIAIAVCFAVALAPVVVSNRHHRSGVQAINARVTWAFARATRRHLYRSGPTGALPEARFALPGLAAPIQATTAFDSAGRPFALLHHPGRHTLTAVIQASPEGGSLVDDATVDHWVASWGEFLAALGQEQCLVAASVTVETAPDPGTRLAAQIRGRMQPDAPELARSVLEEILASYPASAALTTAAIALTWTTTAGAGGGRRSVAEVAAAIGRRLPALCLALATTGAGAARPMTVEQLAGAIRGAFDPEVAGEIEAAEPGALAWEDCGPVSHDESPGAYAHDGAVSVSWTMTAPPRGAVPCTVLVPLLAPHPDIARKRVTLLYRPHSAAQAATLVERDHRDALFSANASRIPRAVDLAKLRAAQQAAEEDARGAGMVRFGLIVTATVSTRPSSPVSPHCGPDTAEALARAASAVEALATTSRLVLRRAWRCQATTFLAGLPLGLVLPQHLRIPSEFKELL